MLRLRRINLSDIEKEYEYISAVPADENGFLNDLFGAPREGFASAVQRLMNHRRGLDLPEGFVPETHYMLWDGENIVGWFRLRHHLCPSLENGGGHIGYSIREGYRGRGYASEGLRLTVAQAACTIPEKEIYLRVRKNNPASLRVMQKNGGYVHHEDESCLYVRIALDSVRSAIQEGIRQEEMHFPRLFATYVEKEYGILFYMPDNPDSYDGNHACLYPENISDLGSVLDDIAAFYRELGMRASVYHPFAEGYFRENEAILRTHGYTYVPEEPHRVMLLTGENQIAPAGQLDIRVLREWDARIAEDILLPSGEPWEIAVTKRRIAQEGAYLFVGYLEGRAVVYTDIHISPRGNTRFDYIVTAKTHRGKGYASELLSFVVEYCKAHSFPVCWQWAGPSEHICCQAGFREAFSMEAGYATLSLPAGDSAPCTSA